MTLYCNVELNDGIWNGVKKEKPHHLISQGFPYRFIGGRTFKYMNKDICGVSFVLFVFGALSKQKT